MINSIKLILAILFFFCLLKMPYGYYELVRFVAMVGFAYLAFDAQQKENQKGAIIYIILALLFQPFFKIALGRFLWNVVDVIVGIYLLLSIFIKTTPLTDKINKSKEKDFKNN